MTPETTGSPPSSAAADLRTVVRGPVLLPGDDGWDDARRAWNLTVPQEVAAVVHVHTPEDVAATVRYARGRGLTVTVQPSGHGATAALDGCILLRTGEMDEVTVDPVRGTCRVGPGATWSQVAAATTPHGLTGLCGSSGAVTVVGYTLGGGLPWFGRRYGFAADSVLAFDVVDAGGDQRRVTARTDPELFWALRGGGGDFAVVTGLEFRLFPGTEIFGGRRVWPADRTREVLDAYRAVTAVAPEALTVWFSLLNLPPLDVVPEPLRGVPAVAVDATFLGPQEAGEALLRPLRELDGEMVDTYGAVAPDELSGITAEPTDPMPVLETSAMLRTLDDATAEAFLAQFGPGTGSPVVMAQLRHLGGALARPAEGGGAVGHLDAAYSAHAVGVAMTPESGQATASRLVDLRTALTPYATGRRFHTFKGADPGSGDAFDPAVLARLQAVKRRYDPHGVVRGNRPVLPDDEVPQVTVPEQR
jgi:FAD/FMN-containing dehydrogenase